MTVQYTESVVSVSEICLDQENPRFPPTNSEREAIEVMLKEQGEKIVSLASDIYQYGLNPSSKLILFKDKKRYVDGDGNRRLTALKLLETPRLAESEPKLKRKIEAILKRSGTIPTDVGCVIFNSRADAKHWISLNHNGPQDGKGQTAWDSEQKNRFEGKYTIGLQALDLLTHEGLISAEKRTRINKTTLDRLLSFKEVKLRISISKSGEHFTFGKKDELRKVILALQDVTVDEVYTAKKGISFVDRELRRDVEVSDVECDDTTGSRSDFKPISNAPSAGNPESDANRGGQTSARSRRIAGSNPAVFGGPLSLKPGHVNNLYRDIELLHDAYKKKKLAFSGDFVGILRMSLRMLAEAAASDSSTSLKPYLEDHFDQAKGVLDQDKKTFLSSKSVGKSKIVELFHAGAHNYTSARDEAQYVALSIILGAILTITHGK